MKRLLTISISLLIALSAFAQKDTLRVSSLYTSHVIFSTDVTYADLSNSRTIAAKVIDQNKNMIALKAKEPFTESCSVSALESNGKMWTFIVVYDESPKNLIIDTREVEQKPSLEKISSLEEKKSVKKGSKKATASTWKAGDAPSLSEVHQMKKQLHHIGATGYDITVLCENLFSYSDITYIVFSVENKSGISYQVSDATFVIESRKQSKRTVAYDQTVFPKSRFGSLNASPGNTGKIVYSFDKMTLSKDQILRVYLYENGGQRNLVMSITPDDINKAKNLSKTR